MSPSESLPLTKPFPRPNHHFRWNLRRGRKRLPTVRLGGNQRRRGGFFLVRLCRKVKLKWLRLKYLSMLRTLKKYYETFMEDVLEGSRSAEAFRQRMLLETSFAIPVMGLSFNTYPTSSYARERAIF